MTTNIYKKKDILHLEKKSIYFIKSGVIKIYVFNADGQERLLWILGSGCIIPTFNMNFHKNVVCMKTTKVINIDKSYFIKALINNNLFEEFTNQIYTRYESIIQRLINTSQDSCISRFMDLLVSLYYLSENHGPALTPVDSFLSRQDMAELVGTHVTNISKFLLSLELQGLILRRGKQILIPDIAPLRHACETFKKKKSEA
ncbi:Crp/Fnr family transcriptional regulator [Mailhella massiliensis]